MINKQVNCLSWCKSRNQPMSLIVGTDDDAQIWELNSTNHQWERKWVFSDNSGIIRNVSWSSNYGKDYETVATASSVIIEGQDNV